MSIVELDRFEQAALKIVQAHLDFIGNAGFAAADLVG